MTNADKSTDTRLSEILTLVKTNYKVFFDSLIINTENFQIFFGKNRLQLLEMCPVNPFLVPDFEKNQIDKMGAIFDIMCRQNIFSVLPKELNDYTSLMKYYKLQGHKKLCFIVGNIEKKNDIISVAKNVGLFVKCYSLDTEGNIVSFSEERSIPSNKKSKFKICSTPEAIEFLPIHVDEQLVSGSKVFDSKGRLVTLGEKVMNNINAVTYETNLTGMWAKIYHTNSLNTFIEAKIIRMVENPLKFKGLCWPLDILRDNQGNFRGFILNMSQGEPLHLCVFKRVGLDKFNWNKRDLCDLAITILSKIRFLHDNNVLMGCINPAAIRVFSKDEVYFLDTDDYQVDGFPTFVHNNTFMPPELLDHKIYFAEKSNENFAVAEMAFMLLMPGKFPYTITSDAIAKDTIKAMIFPFSHDSGKVHSNKALPGMWRFVWSHLTPILKESFANTFQNGAPLNAPEKRLSADDWIKYIKWFRKDLENPFDKESLQIYPKTFKHSKKGEETEEGKFYECRYCHVEHPRFYFDKRYFDSHRICKECLKKQSNVCFKCDDCGKTYFYTNEAAIYHELKRQTDDDWKKQRHCHYCKAKKAVCTNCGKDFPFYEIKLGHCSDCRKICIHHIKKCKNHNCKREFAITDKEFLDAHDPNKNFTEPSYCPECRQKRKAQRNFDGQQQFSQSRHSQRRPEMPVTEEKSNGFVDRMKKFFGWGG